MIIQVEMCIYDILCLFLFVLFCFQYKTRIKDAKAFYWGVAAILFVMCFKSSNTGEGLGDLQGYVNLYLGKASMYDSDDVEPGLKFLCLCLHFLPISEFIFITFTTLLIMCPIFWGIKNYSQNKTYSLMLLFALQGVWLVVYIAMRQALAQAFILSAIFVFFNRDKIKKWKIYTIALMIVSSFFHSTPYIIIPLALGAFFIPENKKYLYIALIVSLLLSSTVYIFLADTFLSYFGNISQISRVTSYIEDETYGMDSGYNILNYAPLTILALAMVYYNNISQKNVYFLKAFVMGVVIYNLLGNIPLVNRAVCFLFVLGLVGAVPKIKGNRQFAAMAILILYFIWRNYVHFAEGTHSAYLPYHFIWE